MTHGLDDSHVEVLRRYPRALVHMRRQIEANRFGLILGAGLSKPFKMPTWSELVDCIAQDPSIDGNAILAMKPIPKASLPYKTEMLFEHFRTKEYSVAPKEKHNTRELNFTIATKWIAIVRKHLYKNAPNLTERMISEHPYIAKLIPLVRNSHLTVTFNFDDLLEQVIELSQSPIERKDSRGFETVTNPWTQFRRQKAIIYHPNGFIPQQPMEAPSDRLVFSEASYAEQLIGITQSESASLIDHFTKNTCLLVGLSLDDQSLCNLLAQVARTNPGNYHYLVSYIDPGAAADGEHREAIRRTNFRVYNLVTLFLGGKEIAALADLLMLSDNDFSDFARTQGVKTSFRFYVTGSLGVGKSTAINYFRNLLVYDEWLEPRKKELSLPWDKLTPEQKRDIDEWVSRQFELKNSKLRHDRIAIAMLDRGPLDPLAFTPHVDWSKKAEFLLNTICPGQADWKVEGGRVLMFVGEPSEQKLRLILTQRDEYTVEKLEEMNKSLVVAYDVCASSGVVVIDTRGLLPSDVARRVAEVVHLEEYEELDIHSRLEMIKKGGFNGK